MSALPRKADVFSVKTNVCLVPEAAMFHSVTETISAAPAHGANGRQPETVSKEPNREPARPAAGDDLHAGIVIPARFGIQ
jgi:hypothetical protein